MDRLSADDADDGISLENILPETNVAATSNNVTCIEPIVNNTSYIKWSGLGLRLFRCIIAL